MKRKARVKEERCCNSILNSCSYKWNFARKQSRDCCNIPLLYVIIELICNITLLYCSCCNSFSTTMHHNTEIASTILFSFVCCFELFVKCGFYQLPNCHYLFNFRHCKIIVTHGFQQSVAANPFPPRGSPLMSKIFLHYTE